MRLSTAWAVCLSVLPLSSSARILRADARLQARDEAAAPNPVLEWFGSLVKKAIQPRQGTLCVEDAFFQLANSSYGESVCPLFVNYTAQTIVEEYTPVRYIHPYMEM